MARRAAREISSGQVIALGPGLPSLVPQEISPGAGAWFLTHTGLLNHGPGQNPVGSASLSFADAAAMVHGGHVDTAVIETAWVTAGGDFGHRTHDSIILELGGLDPELVISPGIFVNRVVQTI